MRGKIEKKRNRECHSVQKEKHLELAVGLPLSSSRTGDRKRKEAVLKNTSAFSPSETLCLSLK